MGKKRVDYAAMNMTVCFGVVISMKKQIFLITVMILLSSRLGVGGAIDNPAGIATIPQSSIRSGLIRSPNPIDRSGNLIITGNIGGGKHFRGVVPYSATSDFTGPLGSSSLDSFLRQSASSQDFGRYTGVSRPYFSSSRTVTTTRAGVRGVVSSPSAFTGVGAVRRDASSSLLRDGTFVSERLSDVQDLTADSGLKLRPVSEQERLALANLDIYSQGNNLADTLRLTRVQGIAKTLSREKARSDSRYKSLFAEVPEMVAREESLSQKQRLVDLQISNQQMVEDLARRIAKIKEKAELVESRALQGSRDEEPLIEMDGTEVVQKNMPELSDISDLLEAGSSVPSVSPWGETKGNQAVAEVTENDTPERNLSNIGRPLGDLRTGHLDLDFSDRLRRQRGIDEERKDYSRDVYATERLGADGTSAVERATKDYGGGADTLSRYRERFARFSKDRIHQQLKSGDWHLKHGEYYRAADKYTLASVYTGDNPLVWAGKGHALFAAGEYMSSVLFVTRAIESLSVASSSDGVTGIGYFNSNFLLVDRDVIESRIADITKWLEESDVGELHFLLGYAYYQIARFDEAESAVVKAQEKMPESAAVLLLKKAIESSLSR